MSNKVIKPGEDAPRSGQYKVVGPRGGETGTEVTLVKGKPAPPTKAGGGFRLTDPTRHKSGK